MKIIIDGHEVELPGSSSLAQLQQLLARKQDVLTGAEGQMVGFDAEGNAVPQDAPPSGLTQEEGDERYLPLSGGTATGTITVKDENSVIVTGFTKVTAHAVWTKSCTLMDRLGRIRAELTASTDEVIAVSSATGKPIRISGVNTPTEDGDAATKGYVDGAVAAAISGAIEEGY